MEKESLVRSLEFLKEQELGVEVLVINRHRQIAKYVRDTCSEMKHYYDVWHLAKGKFFILSNFHHILYITFFAMEIVHH